MKDKVRGDEGRRTDWQGACRTRTSRSPWALPNSTTWTRVSPSPGARNSMYPLRRSVVFFSILMGIYADVLHLFNYTIYAKVTSLFAHFLILPFEACEFCSCLNILWLLFSKVLSLQVFNRTQRDKFRWAIDMIMNDEDGDAYEFWDRQAYRDGQRSGEETGRRAREDAVRVQVRSYIHIYPIQSPIHTQYLHLPLSITQSTSNHYHILSPFLFIIHRPFCFVPFFALFHIYFFILF